MKCIIAGSRKGVTYEHIQEAMRLCGFSPTEIVSGVAKGADSFGEQYAHEHGIPVKQFPADWKNISHPDAVIRTGAYGKYDMLAGIRRNHQMGDYADALVAIWDGQSRGTKDMIDYATKKGLNVFVYKI
jgi:hypothetical protein